MDQNTEEKNVGLHFYSRVTKDSIDVTILAHSITILQKIIYLLAMEAEGREIDLRARIPEHIESFFSLKCQIPTSGCYAFPMTLEYPKNTLPNVVSFDVVVNKFDKLLGIIQNGKLNDLQNTIRSFPYRTKLLADLKNLIPKPDSKWSLGVQLNNDIIREFTSDYYSKLTNWIDDDYELDRFDSIIGTINAINFRDQKLTLRDNTTGRNVSCAYKGESESSLLMQRRKLVQVFGKIYRDQSGLPISIEEVYSIDEINYSPIIIEEIAINGLNLRAKHILNLPVKLDPDNNQQYMVSYPELAINVYSNRHENLETEIVEQLFFLWKEYACCEDDILSNEAKKLKRNLKNTFTEED